MNPCRFIRVLACLLTLLLLCACAAKPAAPDAAGKPSLPPVGEAPPDVSDATQGAVTHADAEALSFVLNTLTRAMVGDPDGYERPYQIDEPYFIWTALELLGCSCAQASKTDESALVGQDVLLAYAKAAFHGLGELPPIEDYFGISTTYDRAAGTYRMPLLCSYDAAFRMDDFAQNPDGSADAAIGLYSVDDEQLSSVRFRLVKNAAYEANDPLSFPCHVAGAAIQDADSAIWHTQVGGVPLFVDLNGDGALERVEIYVDEDAFCSEITLFDGEQTYRDTLDMPLMYLRAHVGKLDGQNASLYLSGDMASNDYATLILTYADGKLHSDVIYDEATRLMDNGYLEVNSVADVFGTHGATCCYQKTAEGAYMRQTPYIIERYGDPWDYHTLTLQRDGLPVVAEGGTETTLDAGTELLLTETDEESYALLETRDGASYRVDISKQGDDWQWMIGGVSESDWFGELPYAG